MELTGSKIPGCYEIKPHIHRDQRGSFVKTFHAPTFKQLCLCTDFVEEYYSVSEKGVIRGMHFQLPPDEHVKLVYCTSGIVMDVVVDLRKNSPTYGQHDVFELSADRANMVYIPKGMAHGFCVLSNEATMIYKVSTVYIPASDNGIHWDSAGIAWPKSVNLELLSDRDKSFVSLQEFDSPFKYFKELK